MRRHDLNGPLVLNTYLTNEYKISPKYLHLPV